MASNPLREIVLDTGVVVLDGGLATELEANGKNLSVREWHIDHLFQGHHSAVLYSSVD